MTNPTSTPTVDNIYSDVAEFVSDAAGDRINSFDELDTTFDFSPDRAVIPAVQFTLGQAPTNVPPMPDFLEIQGEEPDPPKPINLTPKTAAYNAATSVLATFAPSSLDRATDSSSKRQGESSSTSTRTTGTITQPTYIEPINTAPVPNFTPPTPNMNYPQAPYIGKGEMPESAGLVEPPIPFETLRVAVPPEFLEPQIIDYTPSTIEKLHLPMPEPVELPNMNNKLAELPTAIQPDTSMLYDLPTEADAFVSKQAQWLMHSADVAEMRAQREVAERKIFEDGAARGAFNGHGPVMAELADLNYLAVHKETDVAKRNRDRIARIARDILSTSLQQALRFEQAAIDLHFTYARAIPEIIELNLQSQVQFFNELVSVYNSQAQAVQIQVQAYNDYVRANVDGIQTAAKFERSKRAKLDTNRAKVTAYEAQVQSANTGPELYEAAAKFSEYSAQEYTAYVQGLRYNLDIAKVNLETYERSIRAYTGAAEIARSKIDAYEARVRAEGSTLDVQRQNWRVYADSWSETSNVGKNTTTYNEAQSRAIRAEVGVMNEAVRQQSEYFGTLRQWVRSAENMMREYTASFPQYNQNIEAYNRAVVGVAEARSALDLQFADSDTTWQALNAQRAAAQANIDAGLVAATATTYAGAAQAAFNVRSISASLNASAGAGEGYGYTNSVGENLSVTRSYSYSKEKIKES